MVKYSGSISRSTPNLIISRTSAISGHRMSVRHFVQYSRWLKTNGNGSTWFFFYRHILQLTIGVLRSAIGPKCRSFTSGDNKIISTDIYLKLSNITFEMTEVKLLSKNYLPTVLNHLPSAIFMRFRFVIQLRNLINISP